MSNLKLRRFTDGIEGTQRPTSGSGRAPRCGLGVVQSIERCVQLLARRLAREAVQAGVPISCNTLFDGLSCVRCARSLAPERVAVSSHRRRSDAGPEAVAARWRGGRRNECTAVERARSQAAPMSAPAGRRGRCSRPRLAGPVVLLRVRCQCAGARWAPASLGTTSAFGSSRETALRSRAHHRTSPAGMEWQGRAPASSATFLGL